MAPHAGKPATAATVNRPQDGVVGHDDPLHSHHSRQVQATFVLRLRAAPGRDAIHSLRRLLKYALRQCGLRAISVTEASVSVEQDEVIK
jgi:hypothetical protein